MTVLEWVLAAFGLTSSGISIQGFVRNFLNKADLETLFQNCYREAVRNRWLYLKEHCDPEMAAAIKLSPEELTTVLRNLPGVPNELQDNTKKVISELAKHFARVIKIPKSDSDPRIVSILEDVLKDTIKDLVAQLPLSEPAVEEFLVKSAVEASSEHTEIKVQLEKILQLQEEQRARFPFEEIDATAIHKESGRPEHRNPFRIVKAEEFDHDHLKLAQLFREPFDYENIRGNANVALAGGRGCGKSMILRSLSAPIAVELERIRQNNRDLTFADSGLDFFGVYIKLATGYFYEWDADCRLSAEAAKQLFQHVFNMMLLRSLLVAIEDARDAGLLSLRRGDEEKAVESIERSSGLRICEATFAAAIDATYAEERCVSDYVGNVRLGQKTKYEGRYTYIHNFLDECCQAIAKHVEGLGGKRIYFLLDEYENLSEFQQTVVNTITKLRPLSLTVKIATRTLGIKSTLDLQNEPIQRPRDYWVVDLDYDIDKAEYRDLLLDISSKRLQAEGFTETDIRKLLPAASPFEPQSEGEIEAALHELLEKSDRDSASIEAKWSEYMHQWGQALVFRKGYGRRQPKTYAGFDVFKDLSSGIVSTYLELCRLAFHLAEKKGVPMRDGSSITVEIQNDAAYITSKAWFERVERNVPDHGPKITQLVLDLADMFREKLLRHGSEPEAARLVLRNPEMLQEPSCQELKDVIDDAVRWSVLHAQGRSVAYFPRHKTDVRTRDFIFNRILGPILRLSYRPRWRTEVRVEEIAPLLGPERQQVRNLLVSKYSMKMRTEEGPLFKSGSSDNA